MKDQHTLIKGYRDLTQEEIDLMNEIKAHGTQLRVLIAKLRTLDSNDQRWIDIGEDHLKIGTMALVRSVAKPDGF